MIKKSTFLLVTLFSVYSFAQTSIVDIPNESAVAVTKNVDLPKNGLATKKWTIR